MADTYTLTDDELDTVFPQGCMIVRDVLTGICTAIGRNRLGMNVRLAINVQLCATCDSIVEDGVCPDCDDVDVKALGNGWHRCAA